MWDADERRERWGDILGPMRSTATHPLTPEVAYRILGLSPGAAHREVQLAYRRLAFRHHPDIAGDDPLARAEFSRITSAYRTVSALDRLRLHQPDGAGCCRCCGQPDLLYLGLDRRRYCADCLLQSRRRFLPLPSYRTVRCVGVIALQAAAAGLCVAHGVTGAPGWGLAAAATAVLSLAVLGWHVFSADVIES